MNELCKNKDSDVTIRSQEPLGVDRLTERLCGSVKIPLSCKLIGFIMLLCYVLRERKSYLCQTVQFFISILKGRLPVSSNLFSS